MALPSTRRPQIIEQEINQEEEQDCNKPLTFKIDIKEVFMKMMVKWYQGLGKRDQHRLTKRKLKRRAISVLYLLKYEYERLPWDWVAKLKEATGMKLYERIKNKKDYGVDTENIIIKMDPMLLPPNYKSDLIDKKTGIVKMKPKLEEKDKNQVPIRLGRPFYDLSEQPPPGWWLADLAKGIHHRRELVHDIKEDKIIVYWDYKPEYKEEIMKTLIPNSGYHFNWFQKEEDEDTE